MCDPVMIKSLIKKVRTFVLIHIGGQCTWTKYVKSSGFYKRSAARLCFRLIIPYSAEDGGLLVQWLKLPAWEVGVRGFEHHSGL